MVNHTLNFIDKEYTLIIDTINTLNVQIIVIRQNFRKKFLKKKFYN